MQQGVMRLQSAAEVRRCAEGADAVEEVWRDYVYCCIKIKLKVRRSGFILLHMA